MLGAVTAEIGLADKTSHDFADHDLDSLVDDRGDRTGNDAAFFKLGQRRPQRVIAQLLDAKRDAFLLDVHIKNLGLDRVAFLVFGERLLAGFAPIEVRQVGHAVDFAFEADKEAELGNVLDLALDFGADGILGQEGIPRVGMALFKPERDASSFRVGVEHHDLDFLAGGNDFSGMDVLFGPAHLRHMDQALDPRLQFDEGAVIGNVGDPSAEFGAGGIFGLDPFPRVRFELFHAQRNTLGFGVEPDDLHFHGLTDLQRLGGMVDPTPGNIGDVQKAIDAA